MSHSEGKSSPAVVSDTDLLLIAAGSAFVTRQQRKGEKGINKEEEEEQRF